MKHQADFIVSAKVHADICDRIKPLPLGIVPVIIACHKTGVDLREELRDPESIYCEHREKWMRGADATDWRSPEQDTNIEELQEWLADSIITLGERLVEIEKLRKTNKQLW